MIEQAEPAGPTFPSTPIHKLCRAARRRAVDPECAGVSDRL